MNRMLTLALSLATVLEVATAPLLPDAIAEDSTASVTGPVPVSSASPSPQPRKRRAILGSATKDAEGTAAPNRFESETVIKSQYTLDGKLLEVDPD